MAKTFEYNKTIRDPDGFRDYLIAGGFKAKGVARRGNVLFVQPEADEEKDPTTLVNAYVPPDYYEISSSTPATAGPDGMPCHAQKVGTTATITVKKKKGSDGSLLPVSEQVDVHWHGSGKMALSSPNVQLTGGQGSVQIGPAPAGSPGGFVGTHNVDPRHPHIQIKITG